MGSRWCDRDVCRDEDRLPAAEKSGIDLHLAGRYDADVNFGVFSGSGPRYPPMVSLRANLFSTLRTG